MCAYMSINVKSEERTLAVCSCYVNRMSQIKYSRERGDCTTPKTTTTTTKEEQTQSGKSAFYACMFSSKKIPFDLKDAIPTSLATHLP